MFYQVCLVEQTQSTPVAAFEEAANGIYSVIKSQVGTFLQSSQALEKLLDAATAIHPILAGKLNCRFKIQLLKLKWEFFSSSYTIQGSPRF
jgi:hypothetical protein